MAKGSGSGGWDIEGKKAIKFGVSAVILVYIAFIIMSALGNSNILGAPYNQIVGNVVSAYGNALSNNLPTIFILSLVAVVILIAIYVYSKADKA